MNINLYVYFLFLVILQGCSQGHSSGMKDKDFENYINSDTKERETANREPNSIINIAF